MITDNTMFIEGGDASQSAGSTVTISGSGFDFTSAASRLGDGEPMWLIVSVATDIITGGVAGTLNYTVVTDNNAGLDSGTTIATGETFVTDDVALTACLAGTVLLKIPLPSTGYLRYLGVRQTTTTTTTTAGTVDVFLVKDPSQWEAKADATN